jgi:DNA-binding transcriptional MerR regulator
MDCMRKKDPEQNDSIKIGELARLTGVSIPTIHYYLHEGLLAPPVRKSRNMAYYDPKCVEEIQLIKELQTRRFLPLSAIKMILQAKREGQGATHVDEMQSFLEEVFHPVVVDTMVLSLRELKAASGLAGTSVKGLEKLKFLAPHETEKGPRYDDIDLKIARIFKKVQEYGFTAADLEVYRQYIEAVRTEARALHKRMHRMPDMEKIPLTEVFKMFNELKAYLAMRIYRQEIFKSHALQESEGEKT